MKTGPLTDKEMDKLHEIGFEIIDLIEDDAGVPESLLAKYNEYAYRLMRWGEKRE